MKIILSTLLIFLSCVIFYAQDNKNSAEIEPKFTFSFYDDGCGDPFAESQLYTNREGKIIKIISANEVVFEQNTAFGKKDKQKFTVVLIGIDSEQNRDNIKVFLNKYALNQSVRISANLRKKSDRKFSGSFFLDNENEDIDDLNEYLLETGRAKFVKFNSANLVPYYLPCRYEKAEQQAKGAKLGIWAK